MKVLRIVSWVILGFSFATLMFAYIDRSRRQAAIESEAAAEPVYVAPFSLVDQSSRTVTLADLRGKVWVADFIFTRCGGPCPLLTQKMKSLTEEFPAADLRFVSFSIDPAYDTPKVLKAYAEKWGADLTRWSFLTGDIREIGGLMRKSFMLGLDRGADVGGAPDITHSVRFAVVDRDGRLAGTFDAMDVDGMRGLRDELRRLAP